MEIKPITKKLSLEYPKQEKVGIDKLKVNIPSVWMKAGITLGVFKVMMMNKVLAIPTIDIDDPMAGVTMELQIVSVIKGVSYFNILMMIILFASMLIMKLRIKKVNRKLKIAFWAFTILYLLAKAFEVGYYMGRGNGWY